MTTKFYTFTGEAVWSKVYEGQLDPKYENWSVGVVLDPESQIDLVKSGLSVQPKDYEGKKFYTFRRPKTKLINNQIKTFDPIPVTWTENGSPVKFDKTIGNGSKIAVRVAVYDTRKGPGHRLEALHVIEWKEYVKPEVKTQEPQPSIPALSTGKGMPW